MNESQMKELVVEVAEILDPQHQGVDWPDPVAWDGRPVDQQLSGLLGLVKAQAVGSYGEPVPEMEALATRIRDALQQAEAPDRNGPSGCRAPLPPRRVLGQQAGATDKGGRPMTEAQARAFIGRQWDDELAGLDWSEWYPVLRWSGRIHDVAPAAMTIAEAAAHGWMYDSGRRLYFLR